MKSTPSVCCQGPSSTCFDWLIPATQQVNRMKIFPFWEVPLWLS